MKNDMNDGNPLTYIKEYKKRPAGLLTLIFCDEF